jgi:hypothetical protein
MLNVIKNSSDLLEVFQDQSFILWNNPDIINLIEAIIGKYIGKDSCIYSIPIQFKMSLQSLIDNPKELLELIECLRNLKQIFGNYLPTKKKILYPKKLLRKSNKRSKTKSKKIEIDIITKK